MWFCYTYFGKELLKIIKDKHDVDLTASNFDKFFEVFGDKVSDLFIFVP